MGLEGNFYKKKSIDGEWIKKNETKENMYAKPKNNTKDSYDYLFDEDVLSKEYLKTRKIPLVGNFANIEENDKSNEENFDMLSESNFYSNNFEESRKNLLKNRLGIDEETKNAVEDVEEQKSDEIKKDLEESETTELWNASDLGKYTINTQTQEKDAVEQQDMKMDPVNKLEFEEISDDVDLEDAEMQKKFEETVTEIE